MDIKILVNNNEGQLDKYLIEDFAELKQNLDKSCHVIDDGSSIKGHRGITSEALELAIRLSEVGLFAGVYTLIKDFIDHHRGSSVTIKTKDGRYEINLNNLSKSEALEKLKEISGENE